MRVTPVNANKYLIFIKKMKEMKVPNNGWDFPGSKDELFNRMENLCYTQLVLGKKISSN